jgi:hypothetical protein
VAIFLVGSDQTPWGQIDTTGPLQPEPGQEALLQQFWAAVQRAAGAQGVNPEKVLARFVPHEARHVGIWSKQVSA